jgi:hypothetical protein
MNDTQDIIWLRPKRQSMFSYVLDHHAMQLSKFKDVLPLYGFTIHEKKFAYQALKEIPKDRKSTLLIPKGYMYKVSQFYSGGFISSSVPAGWVALPSADIPFFGSEGLSCVKGSYLQGFQLAKTVRESNFSNLVDIIMIDVLSKKELAIAKKYGIQTFALEDKSYMEQALQSTKFVLDYILEYTRGDCV